MTNMSRVKECIILLLSGCAILVYLMGTALFDSLSSTLNRPIISLNELDEDIGNIQHEREMFRQQRDNLSSAMMQLSKEYHQYQCQAKGQGIASHGGWCVTKHYTDSGLALALADLFRGDKVASFGDGEGAYKKLIDESGKVPLYESYDGAPFCENKTHGVVRYLDLTIPVYGLRIYDWILCLEVGEHVPKASEQVLLDSITRHARKGVVVSWATPNQIGNGHVNCQPLPYIVTQMDERGFYHDANKTEMLKNKTTNRNLKKNINVYLRKADHTFNTRLI